MTSGDVGAALIEALSHHGALLVLCPGIVVAILCARFKKTRSAIFPIRSGTYQ
jgi:hypothetical protein